MSGWCVLGLVLAALAVLLALPVGVRARWNGALLVRVRLGPLRIQVFPIKEKKKPPKEKKEKPPKEKERKKGGICLEQIVYSAETLLRLLGRLLRRFCRGLRVDPLTLHITAADEDPADAAILYGRLYGTLSALLPLLRAAVPIRNEDIVLLLDFDKPALALEADVGVHMRLFHVLLIGLAAVWGAVGWLIGFRRRAKPAKPAEKTEQTAEKQSA